MAATLPAVSIVLPTHNGARFIRESLDSCLAQTHTDWELIVVDDASTDDTPAILAAYAASEPRMRVLRNEQNRQLPTSLNLGFAAARGRYFTWTSDDNCYHPTALERLAAVLDQDGAIEVVYAPATVIDERGQPIGRMSDEPPSQLALRNCVGACFLYRRQVQEALGGYDAARVLIEDYDFWLRASMQFRFFHFDQELYSYRLHEGSLTTTKRRQVIAATQACLLAHLPHLHWLSAEQRREAYGALLRSALERADFPAARTIFAEYPQVQGTAAADQESGAAATALGGDYAGYLEAYLAEQQTRGAGYIEAERRERERTEAAFRTLESHVGEQTAYVRKLEAVLAERERHANRSILDRLLRR